jgi:hypothetical protein
VPARTAGTKSFATPSDVMRMRTGRRLYYTASRRVGAGRTCRPSIAQRPAGSSGRPKPAAGPCRGLGPGQALDGERDAVGFGQHRAPEILQVPPGNRHADIIARELDQMVWSAQLGFVDSY